MDSTRRKAGLALLIAVPLALTACSDPDDTSRDGAAADVSTPATATTSGPVTPTGTGALPTDGSTPGSTVSSLAGEAQDALNSASSAVSSVIAEASSAAAGAVDTGAGARSDVTLASCSPGQFGSVVANLSVRNSGSQAQSYAVTVTAKGPDGATVATLVGAAPRVAPGGTQNITAVGLAGDPPANLDCTVSNVTRVGG